jgi:hypothetical protein
MYIQHIYQSTVNCDMNSRVQINHFYQHLENLRNLPNTHPKDNIFRYLFFKGI